MWTVSFSFISGVMVGIELFDPDDGVKGVAIDLGILRIVIHKDEDDDDDEGNLRFI